MSTPWVLIGGSLAYDTILETHAGLGAARRQPGPISVIAHALRHERGGCAGNIAYGLARLGTSAMIDAAAGDDFARYREALTRWGVDTSRIEAVPDAACAQAFIVSGSDGEQMTVFHPGAMARAAPRPAAPVPPEVRVALLSPDDPAATRALARALEGHRAAVLFDPGQGLGNFEPAAVRALCAQADALLVNEGEWAALCAHAGQTPQAMVEASGTVVVTQGARGASVWTGRGEHRIAAVPARAVRDPTGCGDALRAGLAHALAHGATLADGVRLGCAVAAQKVAGRGAQGYTLDLAALKADYAQCYHAPCPVALGR